MPSRPQLDLSEYLPYLINRVGSALVVDFGRSTLTPNQLSIAMWRVLAALSSDDGQRQIDLAAMTSIDDDLRKCPGCVFHASPWDGTAARKPRTRS